MSQQLIRTGVVTDLSTLGEEDLPEFRSDTYEVDVSWDGSPVEWVNSYPDLPGTSEPPDMVVIEEDLSEVSRNRVINFCNKHRDLLQCPVLLHNVEGEEYEIGNGGHWDHIYSVDDAVESEQFQQILLDLKKVWRGRKIAQ